MAKELGLNPRSLIKNIPSPSQQWKLPVKQWIRELYEKRTAKAPVRTHPYVQSQRHNPHSSDNLTSLLANADERELTDNSHSVTQTMIEDWEEYAAAMWDDNSLQPSVDSSLHREIREENQRSR